MPDHLKVGVTDPMRNGGSTAGKEVVKNGDFVSEEHESIDEMRTDETGTTGDCRAQRMRETQREVLTT